MKDSVVVITGASRGLGKSLAEAYAAQGAKVVISGRTERELKETADTIGAAHIVADVTKESDVKKLADYAVSLHGRIDAWINNAGIWLPWTQLEDIDMKKAHELFEVNFFGQTYGSKHAVIQMKKQQRGTLVNIISTSALEGRPLATMYCASKFAVRGLTEALRVELKDTPIKVVGIFPGGIKTHLFEGHEPPDFDKFMTVEHVVGKIMEHMNQPNPGTELIIYRPGQK
jgi:NAD(P)-dependent dehydrogenase (short-subunit alcohol dehydrogenase family)